MTKEDKKVMSFTIDNHGGMPEEIHIDWETVPTGRAGDRTAPNSHVPDQGDRGSENRETGSDYYTGRIVVIVDGRSLVFQCP